MSHPYCKGLGIDFGMKNVRTFYLEENGVPEQFSHKAICDMIKHLKIYDIKRLIGRAFTDPTVVKALLEYPFQVVNVNGNPSFVYTGDKSLIPSPESTLYPQEVLAKIIYQLKMRAEAKLTTDLNKLVLTIPAHFNWYQQLAMQEAGSVAGFSCVELLHEPVAAAISYYRNYGWPTSEEIIIAIQIEIETLDAALLRINGNGINIEAIANDQGFDAWESHNLEGGADQWRQSRFLEVVKSVSNMLDNFNINKTHDPTSKNEILVISDNINAAGYISTIWDIFPFYRIHLLAAGEVARGAAIVANNLYLKQLPGLSTHDPQTGPQLIKKQILRLSRSIGTDNGCAVMPILHQHATVSTYEAKARLFPTMNVVPLYFGNSFTRMTHAGLLVEIPCELFEECEIQLKIPRDGLNRLLIEILNLQTLRITRSEVCVEELLETCFFSVIEKPEDLESLQPHS